jgi:hypothetical protein
MIRSFLRARAQPVERVVQLYVRGTRVIVAATHRSDAGLYYEQADPKVVEVREPAELGAAFRAAFDAFSLRDRDVTTVKKSDWPAYIASGLPSMKAFEREYTAIQCAGLNPSNAVVRASRVYPADPSMELSIAFNPLLAPGEIGALLLRLARVGVPGSGV